MGGKTVQLAHDELQKQHCGFCGLPVFGEIPLYAFFFLAAERRIGDDDMDALLFTDLGELEAQRVAGVDLRRVEAVQ